LLRPARGRTSLSFRTINRRKIQFNILPKDKVLFIPVIEHFNFMFLKSVMELLGNIPVLAGKRECKIVLRPELYRNESDLPRKFAPKQVPHEIHELWILHGKGSRVSVVMKQVTEFRPFLKKIG
jgi:hypothetical protein